MSQSKIEKNKSIEKLYGKYSSKREKLKATTEDESLPMDVRLEAMIKLSELPRNSSKNRYKNRCSLTGRPRSYYRKFGISRIMLRQLASLGLIPGVKKSSW